MGSIFGALMPLVYAAIAIFLMKVLVQFILSPKIKGRIGEWIVSNRLKKQLDPTVYHLLDDIMLPTPDGTTQIDHVVVSRYGIFVVETKTYTGWIYGNERDPQWTQVVFRRKSQFQNPLRQNYRHTKTLADRTGIPEEYFKPAVAFGGDCTFKTEMPPGVCYSKKLVAYIHGFRTPIIQDKQVPEIITAIREWAGTVTEQQRANHVDHLKARKEPVPADATAPICPLCGTNLVLRTGRGGTRFWGCSKFPACRGTRQAT
jgi:restriction system protein